jgi:hypothetical protein
MAQPDIRHPGPVPSSIGLAAAEQLEEFDRMAGADTVGISDHDRVGL